MILPHILDIVAVCAAKGITKAVISPGSRSAALTIAFEQHPEIEVIMVPDERSAGFIALGIAQELKVPTVLVCTSGSAVLNYAPAISEAYYQEIPLVVLSADRPPEWIDQYDGQTIQQFEVFGKHAKSSFQLPTNPKLEEELWHSNRVINEALNLSMSPPFGPVHINVPIREPFYPSKSESIEFSNPRVIQRVNKNHSVSETALDQLAGLFDAAERPLLIVGHQDPNAALTKVLNDLIQKSGITVINDIIGNQHHVNDAISYQDAFLNPANPRIESLAPDLVISLGKSLISKNLKLFLRKNPPIHHWHVQESERLNDSLQHLTHQIVAEPVEFLAELNKGIEEKASGSYKEKWLSENDNAGQQIQEHLQDSNSEFAAYQTVLKHLPDSSELQVANSMSVRYANMIGLSGKENISVYSNRGTSGIDGSNGTAVGSAIVKDKIVTLLTGDMAFLYDRNAFWHEKDIRNLRIVVFNNAGGGIFRMIPGPTDQPTYEKIFETKHNLTAQATAQEFGFEFSAAKNIEELNEVMRTFFDDGSAPKLVEYFSDADANTEDFKRFKQRFSN